MANYYDLHNLDDMIVFMGDVLEKLGDQVEERGLNSRLAELLIEAETSRDEDSIFKAELLQGFVGRIVNIKLQLEYLRRPVLREGELNIGQDMQAFLGGFRIENGAQIEYMNNGRWNFGVLHYNNESRKYEIWTWDAKTAVTDADGLHARIRGADAQG